MGPRRGGRGWRARLEILVLVLVPELLVDHILVLLVEVAAHVMLRLLLAVVVVGALLLLLLLQVLHLALKVVGHVDALVLVLALLLLLLAAPLSRKKTGAGA